VITGGEPPVNSVKGKSPSGNCIYPIYANGIGENALWGFSDKATVNRSAVTFSSIGTIGHPTIRNSGFTPIIRLKVIYPKNEKVLSLGFLKYALEVTEFKQQKSSLPNINASMVKGILIPLPPLEIQREVVEILDKFAQLTAELTAELQKRKKQYEHYRDFLLEGEASGAREASSSRGSSDSSNSRDSRTSSAARTTRWVRLGEAFQRLRGTPITAAQMKKIKSEDGEITILAGGKTVVRAKEKDIEKANIIRVPAVLVQSRGVIDFIYYDKPFTFKNEMWAYTAENVTTVKYLYYVLRNNARYFREAASGMGSLPQISLRVTEDYPIPLPSLEEQKRIVSILDKFDSLCNSLTEGLPAEIELRKKQYEYYRDKLLDFDSRSFSNSSSSSLEPLER
jgi:type I restriction enzyme S subunit